MNIDVLIRMHFDVSQREFSLIIKALKNAGGNGIKLASELEAHRAKHFQEIVRRYQEQIISIESTSENNGGDE